jgi:V/A-type H+-transporting ATPase subunit D
MKVRHPPGRAGRPWLARRLAIARRGAELLDDKYRALLREQRRLQPLAAATRAEWEREAQAAERWLARAAVLGGRRALAAAAAPRLDVGVRWRTILGVACPVEGEVAGPPPPDVPALGGGAALVEAAAAHRRAAAAAIRLSVLEGALRRVDSELRATVLRRNAIERRWIPAHEAALAQLELSLEELEREDGARVRWLTRASDPL